ncbi:MAG TPA: 2-hydroxyacid dehydrogenase [Alphaproteobacteria bacterium]|nr:2-hydroxyacid dehydrogenase [Alphaproteobacteria bacterium]
MKDVEVLATVPFEPNAITGLDSAYRLHRLWEAEDKERLLAEIGPRIRGLATGFSVGAPAALIDSLPSLEIIANFGVGYEKVDVAHARGKGIPVTNTPDVLTDDVADLAIALWLMTSRRLGAAERYLRAGKWRGGAFPLATSTEGRKVGILGMGRIGQAIARRARLFNAEIRYSQPRRRNGADFPHIADPVALAAWADVLFVATPGGEATRGLVDSRVIDALGPTGTLINIARGSVVDEPALVRALLEGRLGAAGLDVFADEPRAPEALLSLDNVVLLPHVGSATVETRRAMGQLVVDNLAAHFAGRPLLTPVP